MDVREKLVELIEQSGMVESKSRCNIIAEELMQNGVTVQEWSSVKDRLPEKNTSVVTATDNGIVFQCLYAYDGWDLWEGNNVNITHWQPMPQPPKGE